MKFPGNGTTGRTRPRWLLAGLLAALAMGILLVTAYATDNPEENNPSTPVEYDGALSPGVPVEGAIGWTDPEDGYDWYCFNAVEGQKIDLDATRLSGDLLLNFVLYQGVADEGDPVSILGSFVAETDNLTTADVSLNYTPTFSGAVTLVVSTWDGQAGGDYSLTMTGGKAGASCQPSVKKVPRLANLWLCNTGPDDCGNKESGVEEVNLEIRVDREITTLDPKCLEAAGSEATPTPCPPQQIGALDFEVRYDAKFLTLSVTENPDIEGLECVENQMEGTLQVICVTKGKPASAPSGPVTIAVLHVRATPDVYSILIANQGNGIATQLINQDCNLSDLQGHPIKTDGLCEDGAITIRYLEGDVHADCVVDVLDQQQISFRMFSQLGNLLYNSRYDLEPSAPSKGDGDIDAKDVQFVFGRHVSTCKAPWPPQDPVDPKEKLPGEPPLADG